MELPYDHAIVRFSCLVPPIKGAASHLVFASVEFLPAGRGEPESTPLDQNGRPPGISTEHGRLFFRRIGLSASAALDWYRRLDTFPDLEEGIAALPFQRPTVVDEPAWHDEMWPALSNPISPPILPGPMDDDRMDPFVGGNREALRVHRRLSTGDALVDHLKHDPEVVEWLRRRLWVDFSLYPELLGSAALIVPDPEVKTVQMRLDSSADDDGSTLVVETVKRNTTSTELSLLLIEERYGGVAWQQLFDVPASGVVKASRPQPIQSAGYTLMHSERGVIATEPVTGFLRAASVNASILGREVRLHSRDGRGKRAPDSVRSVKEASQETWSTGAPLPPLGRMAEGIARRSSARQNGTEFWVDDPTIARDKLWQLVSDARDSVTFVDPYADGLDLQDYGLASSGARVRLLTALQTTQTRSVVPLEDGLSVLDEAGRQAEARVMSAGSLHDRFIILDDAVWSLGASLNGLGSEATMLIRLREPQPIRETLERIWASSRKVEVET